MAPTRINNIQACYGIQYFDFEHPISVHIIII